MSYIVQRLNKCRVKTKTCPNYFSRNLNMAGNESPVASIREGKIKGDVKKLLNGSSYFSFKGIPYGQPPIGNLRFQFDCDTELNFTKKLLDFGQKKGAAHSDDLYYLFLNNLNRDILEKNDELRKLVFKVTKLWADFAKYGHPTPQSNDIWQPYIPSKMEYLNIDKTFTMDGNVDKGVAFWNKFYSEAGLPCITY